MAFDILGGESSRSAELAHAAGLCLGDNGQRDRLGSISSEDEADWSINPLATSLYRPPEPDGDFANQQRTSVPRAQQSQVLWPQGQQRGEQFAVLFVTMGHQHHRVVRLNSQRAVKVRDRLHALSVREALGPREVRP